MAALDENILQEIEDSRAHKLQLQIWEKEEDIVRQRVDGKENRRSNTQNEIYQLFALYFVFQGVVLSALFQAAGSTNNNSQQSNAPSPPPTSDTPSKHVCKNWWVPFCLSLITSVATIAATIHKLYIQGKIERELEDEKADSRALFKRIEELRRKGRRFDLSKAPRSKTQATRNETVCANIFSPGMRTYTASVTLVLILFSGITLAACRLLLCG